jgi:hypothetical protein
MTMAQNVIEQLEALCGRLRDQLMQQPEYRALVSLEKTIADLSVYMGGGARRATSTPVEEPLVIDVNAVEAGPSINGDPDELADAMVDALRTPKASATARTMDHLPSHRVA